MVMAAGLQEDLVVGQQVVVAVGGRPEDHQAVGRRRRQAVGNHQDLTAGNLQVVQVDGLKAAAVGGLKEAEEEVGRKEVVAAVGS